jgi:DNA-binding GntR family transcriptional regulator
VKLIDLRHLSFLNMQTHRLERPKSLTDLAEERIRAAIIDGRHGLGEQLSEAALAEELGISKTPVREALLRLRGDGLIDIQPQRGAFVFSLAPREVEEICRFREFVEAAALTNAMRERRAELMAALDANVAQMTLAHDAGDWGAIPALDQAFHRIIVDHCENAYLQQAYQLIASKIAALRARLPEGSDRVSHCQENHAAIARLIRDAAPAQARQALELHVQDTLASYLGAIDQKVPG